MLVLALGLILGGGISNMIDRVFFGTELFAGKVIDFIDFRLINFAVFNVADSAVCIGEALLIIYALFIDSKVRGDMFAFYADSKKANSKNDGSSELSAVSEEETADSPANKNGGKLHGENNDRSGL